MQYFRDVEWESTLHEEQHHSDDGNTYTTAYYVISDWKIPFTFADWLKNIGFGTTTGPEKIYEHCSNRLTQPFCKKFVLDAATKLEADPGFVHAFEKMASFYILRLLAGIPRKEAWKTWQKIPKTDALLKDEVFLPVRCRIAPCIIRQTTPNCQKQSSSLFRSHCIVGFAQIFSLAILSSAYDAVFRWEKNTSKYNWSRNSSS